MLNALGFSQELKRIGKQQNLLIDSTEGDPDHDLKALLIIWLMKDCGNCHLVAVVQNDNHHALDYALLFINISVGRCDCTCQR